MKQAILITAYKNYNHLADIVNFFPKDKFEIYIHLDRKSKITDQDIKKIYQDHVKLLSRKYTVNWGGRNHLRCILLLSEKALRNKELTFFHLISGQDFPVKEISHFEDLLKSKVPKDYMDYFEMPAAVWGNENGGMDRIEYYNLYDIFDAKKHLHYIHRLVYFQKRHNVKRPFSSKLPKLYGGSTWWSLTRDTLQYVINYTKENSLLLDRMKHTFCSEEIYFQTVIMNSDFAKNVVNDNLRYIEWESEGCPTVIDENCFSQIISSNTLFARKFDDPKSNELKLMLTSHTS